MKRLAVVLLVLAVGLTGAIVLREIVDSDADPVIVVQWSNSHPMREGLIPEMAKRFNSADHETAAGRPIQVLVLKCDSSVQADDLVSRVKGNGRVDDGCGDGAGGSAQDPTIVTPQSADWLVDVNFRAGRAVVDLESTVNIAETWLGIVTYREMAECLGWPDKEIGYRDIVALRANPEGWAAYPDCAQAEWGRRPLLAFTNPNTSTSGRNVLVSLYSMAADKAPADLTVADIQRPEVVEFVKNFQQLVDHYLPGTLPLNTKIAQGTEYGHFFLMPEDNLVSWFKGNETAVVADGTEKSIGAITDLVMIYPKEGSVLNANPAGLVDAPWVSADQKEGAGEWIEYLRDDEQQRTFMAAGFRPATGTSVKADERQFEEWGLGAQPPTSIIEPGDLAPEVLERIIDSWGAVKNPAIVTLVVDLSGSMEGDPLAQVQDGLIRLLDAMADTDNVANESQVGLVTFSDEVITAIKPQPLRLSKYDIADEINQMSAKGSTALYDAVSRAVSITDSVAGDPRATRAVVVLSDGKASAGMCLHDLVSMSSRDEVPVSAFCGLGGETPTDDNGSGLLVSEVVGESLRQPLDHKVQVFFVSFGTADAHIGRILAQATGAEYQGSTDEDLASVIEELSGYF